MIKQSLGGLKDKTDLFVISFNTENQEKRFYKQWYILIERSSHPEVHCFPFAFSFIILFLTDISIYNIGRGRNSKNERSI